MPAVRKNLPPGRRVYHPVSFVYTQLDLEFEVANDSGKVRCTICFANNSREPWIHRSSTTTHLKSERHNRSAVAKQQRFDNAARDSERWKEATSETEKLFSDSFVPADAIPSVQATRNEPVPVSSRLRTDEEEEMMRRVLKHLDDPQKDDPGAHPAHGWQLTDHSLEAQVAQVIAGNVDAIGSDTGDDDFLEKMMSAACLWNLPPFPTRKIDPTPPQAHSYLLMRLNIMRSGSLSQIRGQNGIHTRARRSVPPVMRLPAKLQLLTGARKDVST